MVEFSWNAECWLDDNVVQVDKSGVPVARLGPMDDPIPKVEKEIEKYLWTIM